MAPKQSSVCDTILPHFLSAPCVVCQQRPEPPAKVHIVKGVYYCPDHCPVHASLFVAQGGAA